MKSTGIVLGLHAHLNKIILSLVLTSDDSFCLSKLPGVVRLMVFMCLHLLSFLVLVHSFSDHLFEFDMSLKIESFVRATRFESMNVIKMAYRQIRKERLQNLIPGTRIQFFETFYSMHVEMQRQGKQWLDFFEPYADRATGRYSWLSWNTFTPGSFEIINLPMGTGYEKDGEMNLSSYDEQVQRDVLGYNTSFFPRSTTEPTNCSPLWLLKHALNSSHFDINSKAMRMDYIKLGVNFMVKDLEEGSKPVVRKGDYVDLNTFPIFLRSPVAVRSVRLGYRAPVFLCPFFAKFNDMHALVADVQATHIVLAYL